MPQVSRAIIVGALGDGQFAFARDGLGLEFVLVDRPDDDRRAELLHQRQHLVEFLLAVLEIDRVDDALALAIGQRPRSSDFAFVVSIMNGTLILWITFS